MTSADFPRPSRDPDTEKQSLSRNMKPSTILKETQKLPLAELPSSQNCDLGEDIRKETELLQNVIVCLTPRYTLP
jgi:hypothetical protein